MMLNYKNCWLALALLRWLVGDKRFTIGFELKKSMIVKMNQLTCSEVSKCIVMIAWNSFRLENLIVLFLDG